MFGDYSCKVLCCVIFNFLCNNCLAEEWQKKFESSVTKRTQLETALINEMDKVTQLQNEIKKLQVLL